MTMMRRSKTTVEHYRSGMDLDDSFRSLCKRNAAFAGPFSSGATANASWGNCASPTTPTGLAGRSSASSTASYRKLQLAAAMVAARKKGAGSSLQEEHAAATGASATTLKTSGNTKKRSLLEEVAVRNKSIQEAQQAQAQQPDHHHRSALVRDSFSCEANAPNDENAAASERLHHQKNVLLKADEINSLLNLLHTNEFAGKADPMFHSCYMKGEPTTFDAMMFESKAKRNSPKKQSPRKKIMMRSSFQSDSHLLNLKEQRNTRMIPAWAS